MCITRAPQRGLGDDVGSLTTFATSFPFPLVTTSLPSQLCFINSCLGNLACSAIYSQYMNSALDGSLVIQRSNKAIWSNYKHDSNNPSQGCHICSYLVVPPSRLAQPWQGLLAQWYAFAESHVFDARRRGRRKGRRKRKEEKEKDGGLQEHDAAYRCQDKMVRKTTKHFPNIVQQVQEKYLQGLLDLLRGHLPLFCLLLIFHLSEVSNRNTSNKLNIINTITLLRLTKCTCSPLYSNL